MIEIVMGAATIRVPPGADLPTLQAVLHAVQKKAQRWPAVQPLSKSASDELKQCFDAVAKKDLNTARGNAQKAYTHVASARAIAPWSLSWSIPRRCRTPYSISMRISSSTVWPNARA